MTYVIDTHALVWFLEDDEKLGISAKRELINPASEIVIPTIVLIEIQYLYFRKRILTDFMEVSRRILQTKNCLIYPLDEDIVKHIPLNLNIHDSIICATAIVFRDILNQQVKIITKDKEIIQSKLIETLW